MRIPIHENPNRALTAMHFQLTNLTTRLWRYYPNAAQRVVSLCLLNFLNFVLLRFLNYVSLLVQGGTGISCISCSVNQSQDSHSVPLYLLVQLENISCFGFS